MPRPCLIHTGLSGPVQALDAGFDHTCALIMGGTAVECFGYNDAGQLGDGTYDQRNTPVAVTGLSGPVQAIALGFSHTCALLTGGTAVECFGGNFVGQLGDGTGTIVGNRLTPVAVTGLSGPVQALALGSYHTCALLTGGTAVECFGANTFGQLGDGTTTHRFTPVAVSGLGA